MPGCPQCGKVWPEGYRRCPEDGAALTPSFYPTAGPSIPGAAPALAPISDDDLPAGSFAGEYRIEKKLGEGGMGSVYGARHPLIGKRAAIKVIRRELSGSREAVDRFVLEAQSVNQIGHPNIVDVFGFGQLPDGRSFFVMEWLEGESLRERMQRPLQFPEALDLLEQIAKALQAAHDAGVVHRDLKPDNVYLQARKDEKPTVKLLDFGLAKLTSRGDGGQQMDRTRTGVVMGTPLYLSPEQAKGAKIDAATDVYSLGAMAYEMLSGVVPFKADSAVEIMAMHISQSAIPLIEVAPWVPPEINALVLQMLEKDTRNRPATAEVRERIAHCRSRASAATIGIHIHASSQPPSSQPPPYTPMPYTPMPYTPMPHTPAAGVHTPPPSMMAMAQPRAGKKWLLVVSAVVLAGAAAAAVFVVLGSKSSKPTEQLAATEPADVDPTAGSATAEPPAVPAAGSAAAGSDAPATAAGSAAPDAAGAEPVKPDPAPVESVTKPDPVEKPDHLKKPDRPRRGRVVVTFAGPARALVLVDGKPRGREASGRVSLELPPGEHTIRVQAKGYKPATSRVNVEAGDTRDVKLTLEKRKSVNAVHDPFAD